VNRGGSWRNDDPSNFRGANRNRNDPSNRNDNLGFRLVSTTAEGKGALSNPPNPVFRRRGTETRGTVRQVVPPRSRGTNVAPAPLSKAEHRQRRNIPAACLVCS